MTAASINRAANDPDLQARTLALAHKEVLYNEALADTAFGRSLITGMPNVNPLVWAVAVNSEAAYETALVAGRGAPGHDQDIITDGAISAAIVANWPYAEGEAPAEPPP